MKAEPAHRSQFQDAIAFDLGRPTSSIRFSILQASNALNRMLELGRPRSRAIRS